MSRPRTWRSPRLRHREWLFAAGIAALAMLLRLLDPAPLASLRHGLFDVEQRLFPRSAPAAPVAVVEVDERSLAELGQWPWPRDLIARLLERIAAARPAVVGLNVIFSEPDRLSPEKLITGPPPGSPTTAKIAALGSTDARLARSLALAPVVLSIAALSEAPADSAAPSASPVVLRLAGGGELGLPAEAGLLRNLEALEHAAAAAGLVSYRPGGDGVVRRLPAVMRVGPTVLPGFALEVVRIAAGGGGVIVEGSTGGVERVWVDGRPVATDAHGDVWLRFSPAEGFLRLSAADLLAGRRDVAALRGRAVLVGAAAHGLAERFVVADGQVLGALDVQAQFVENLMSGELLTRPRTALVIELALVAAACLGVAVARPDRRGTVGHGAALGVSAALAAVGPAAFLAGGWLIDPVAALLGAIATYVALVGTGIAEAQRARRQSERERELALVLAEAANRSKSHFLANMSHELRTPLNAVIGFSEAMLTGLYGAVSPPRYREYVEHIHHTGTQLLGMVNRILEMAEVESGRAALVESVFPLGAVVDEAVAAAGRSVDGPAPLPLVEGGAAMPLIRADRPMVGEMIANLVSNALKSTPTGGEVRISGAAGPGGEWRLAVADTGRGMSRAAMESAFQPFRSSDHTRAAGGEGIGLGLPLTRVMIELHGGRVEIAAGQDGGTVATLVFPADRVCHGRADAGSPPRAAAEAQEKGDRP